MKIRIDQVPESGLSLRWDEPPATLDARLRAGAGPAARGGPGASDAPLAARTPIHAELVAARVQRAVAVKGRLRATVGLDCGRCLTSFDMALDLPTALLAVPERPVMRAEDEADDPLEDLDLSGLPFDLPGDDLEVVDYTGSEIDLSATVVDQVVLNLPAQPLCDAACRGLCAQCGQDLNQAPCGCANESVDPRLAALRKLKTSR